MPLCTAIVPFYNEKERVLYVLKQLIKVNNLEKIICVDDGSEDKSLVTSIKNRFKNVYVIRLNKNMGKSHAVSVGLQHVRTPYVMLMDADLSNINPKEIIRAISFMDGKTPIDLLILRIINFPWYAKLIRGDVLSSGQRILSAHDLREVYKTMRPQRYQLEFAINFFMMKNKRKAYWISYSARNVVKVHKLGLLKGLSSELTMYLDMVKYVGLITPIKSLVFFCKSSVVH